MNEGTRVLTGRSMRLEGRDGVEEIILQDDPSHNSLFKLQDDSQSASSSLKSADSTSGDSQITSFPVGFLATEGLGEIRSIQEMDGVEDDQELKLALGHIDTQLALDQGPQDLDEDDEDDDESDSEDSEDEDDVMIVTEAGNEDVSQVQPKPDMANARPKGLGVPRIRSYMRVSKKKKKKYKFREVSSSSFVRKDGDPEENPDDLTYTVDNSRFTCKLCGAFFLGRRSLALHMQSYHNFSINKKFTTSGNEVRSLLTHPAAATAKTEDLGFICKICDPPSIYSSQRGLLQHTRKVHPQATLNPRGETPRRPPLNAFTVDAGDGGPVKIRFRCWHCSASFPTLAARMSHLQQEHTINGAKPLDEFPCEVCGFKTQNLVAYGNHTQIHDVSGLGLASYNNEIQEFSKESGGFKLIAKEKKEEEQKPPTPERKMPVAPPEEDQGPRLPSSYKCPECGAEFQQAQEMKVHCSILHPNRKIYMCRFCCKLEKDKDSLEDHESSHFPGYTPKSSANTSGGGNTGNTAASNTTTPTTPSSQQPSTQSLLSKSGLKPAPKSLLSGPPQSQPNPPTPLTQHSQNQVDRQNSHSATTMANNMYPHPGHATRQPHPYPYPNNPYGMPPYHMTPQGPMNVHPAFPQNNPNMYMGRPMGYYGNNFGPGGYNMQTDGMSYGMGMYGNANMNPNNPQMNPMNHSGQMNFNPSQGVSQGYPYHNQAANLSTNAAGSNAVNSTASSTTSLSNSQNAPPHNVQSTTTPQQSKQSMNPEPCKQPVVQKTEIKTEKEMSENSKRVDSVETKEEEKSTTDQELFECHLCDEVFKNKKHYDNHMEYEFLSQPSKVRGQKGPPYPCCDCFKAKYDMKALLNHVEEVHPKISFNTGMLCMICLKICEAKVFQMHTDMHRKDKMQCVFCKKLFVSRNAYEGHMTVELARMAADTVRKVLPPPQLPSPITTAANEIICPSCDMRFISLQSYNRHKCGNRRLNAGSYFCRLCGMRFDRHKDLRRHRCEDSATKCVTCGQENEPGHNCSTALFGCKSCNISFNTEAECMKHIATAHCNPPPPNTNGTPRNRPPTLPSKAKSSKSNQISSDGSIDDDLLSCVACKMTFETFQERSKHILTEHIGGKKKQPEPPPLSFLPPSMFMSNINS